MTNDIKLQGKAEAKKRAPAKKRKKSASLDKIKSRAGWIFVLPFLIGFVFVYFPILCDSIKMSLTIRDPAADAYVWCGIDNFKEALLEDPDFTQVLLRGLQEIAFDIPAILIFSLFMAVLLNQKMAGRAFFRAILFVPVIISSGIMNSVNEAAAGGDFDDMSGIDGGGIATGEETSTSEDIVNAMDIAALLGNMKVGTELVEYVTQMVNGISSIVKSSGVQILVFLSGLQSISPAIYESCQIDGATAWETFWKITFPMISPMILVNAVYTVIDAFTNTDSTIMSFISGIEQNGGRNLSTAMSWLYFLIVILIVLIVAGICSAFVFYQRKND